MQGRSSFFIVSSHLFLTFRDVGGLLRDASYYFLLNDDAWATYFAADEHGDYHHFTIGSAWVSIEAFFRTFRIKNFFTNMY